MVTSSRQAGNQRSELTTPYRASSLITRRPVTPRSAANRARQPLPQLLTEKQARRRLALHGRAQRLDDRGANQIPGCGKRQSSSRATAGRAAHIGQKPPRAGGTPGSSIPAAGIAQIAESGARASGAKSPPVHMQTTPFGISFVERPWPPCLSVGTFSCRLLVPGASGGQIESAPTVG